MIVPSRSEFLALARTGKLVPVYRDVFADHDTPVSAFRKIDEGERTATTLVARKNAAQAQRKVAEALSGVGNADNAFAALGRFEESVAREEATAKAFNQIAATGKDPDLEKEFLALEGGGVEDELAQLKRERGIRPPDIPVALPPPGEKTAGR